MNHLGAAMPNCVSFKPIVCLPSTKTLYSVDIANRQPPAGLEPCAKQRNIVYSKLLLRYHISRVPKLPASKKRIYTSHNVYYRFFYIMYWQ